MIESRLKEVLTDFVVYLYPSFKITGDAVIEENKYCVLLENGSLNVKGDLNDTKGFNIEKDSQFLPSDKVLIENFLQEVNVIESYSNLKKEYLDTLINQALYNAIASTLSPKATSTISNVINVLSKLSERTYEGKSICYGVIVNDNAECLNKVENVYFTEYVNNPYSSVLTNGTESFVEVDPEGYIVRYLQLNYEKSDNGLAPYDYTRVLEYCDENITAIVLNAKGEILIFHNNELKYTKRGGRWNPYSHIETIQVIHERSKNDNKHFARAVYLSALDVSFKMTGGIISFLDENEVQNALKHINIRDIVNEHYFDIKREQMMKDNDPDFERIKDISFQEFLRKEENGKSCVLNRIINGRSFGLIYRKLREELISIDGATILDYNGNFVAVGAIVKIEAGSVGGGRLAAAKTLSRYGIAIEISSDASIKGFALNENDECENIFTISDFK